MILKLKRDAKLWAAKVLTASLCLTNATAAVEIGHVQSYNARGVVTKIEPESDVVVIRHESIPGYMPAMEMPFKVKDRSSLRQVHRGNEIGFRLMVTTDSSWIDQITPSGKTTALEQPAPTPTGTTNALPRFRLSQIPDFALTNELGQHVSLAQFSGRALALTFFFTRCPIPEFCPRLSKNFEEASEKLLSMKAGPTNWEFVSISFDPSDTPAILRAYAQQYQYDSNHWTFLTGDPKQIRELTHGFGVSVTSDGGVFSHDFRTAIFDASGQLQALWPFGGNSTDLLVCEILKGTAATRPDHGSEEPTDQRDPAPRR